MLLLIPSATICPSTAITVPNGYSPLLTATRDNSMQRAIIALSVSSHEIPIIAIIHFFHDQAGARFLPFARPSAGVAHNLRTAYLHTYTQRLGMTAEYSSYVSDGIVSSPPRAMHPNEPPADWFIWPRIRNRLREGCRMWARLRSK